ncbi:MULTISPECIES: hypothetical protein [unclassified Amycolatopsis]|uniref:hypothetical protein n=1 Tax=unclassified Amycolatopsis TaxID=2618356 RepID=UPI002875730F|nr:MULTISPECIES: hypothetical protein [unclassified Amycolatopsis]MDS0140155.1 hypothetical protein [Amycolatopsis sp. 505]MDS0148709.1 hypothetical protein [Amycolatopsis sp. CM201R]
MTRSARRRRDRVTVDELLRQTGEQPRKPGSRAAELAARRGSGAEPGPSGVARMALASAVIVVLGGLVVVLAVRPDSGPGDRQFPQLQPATAVPTSTALALPTETTTPSPVVMHARRTPTPTPTVTVELPPPPATSSPAPSTWDPRWNYYGCYPYNCGRR